METASHLSVILDLSPTQWHLSSMTTDQTPYTLADFLPELFVFLNAHLVSQHENTLNVFGAFPGKSTVLYSSHEDLGVVEADANVYQPFKGINTEIMRRLTDELDALPDTEAPVSLVGALTKCLCYINRLAIASTPNASTLHSTPRILIVSVSPDLSASYIPIMNSIFCAQKLKVILDVCKVYGPDTVFLQQAAHLTGGSYISIPDRQAVLQYLMTSFLSPPALRKLMAVPTEDKVDFRAACFCHKTIVDIGFICSVCLSIFCKPTPVCSTCRAKFSMKTLQRLKEAFKPSLPPGIPEQIAVPDSPPPSKIPLLKNQSGKGAFGQNGYANHPGMHHGPLTPLKGKKMAGRVPPMPGMHPGMGMGMMPVPGMPPLQGMPPHGMVPGPGGMNWMPYPSPGQGMVPTPPGGRTR